MTDGLFPQNSPPEAEKISATKRVMRKISALAKRLRTTVFSVSLVLGLALSAVSPAASLTLASQAAAVPCGLSHAAAVVGGGGFCVVNHLNAANVLTLVRGIGLTSPVYNHVRDYIRTKLSKKVERAHIDDIADCTVTRIVEGKDGFSDLPPQLIKARLHVMMKYSLADFYRKLRRQERLKKIYYTNPADNVVAAADQLIAKRDFEEHIEKEMTVVPEFLTKREGEVYLLAINGSSNEEIAEKIGAKIGTVKKHRANYNKKFQLRAQKWAA